MVPGLLWNASTGCGMPQLARECLKHECTHLAVLQDISWVSMNGQPEQPIVVGCLGLQGRSRKMVAPGSCVDFLLCGFCRL